MAARVVRCSMISSKLASSGRSRRASMIASLFDMLWFSEDGRLDPNDSMITEVAFVHYLSSPASRGTVSRLAFTHSFNEKQRQLPLGPLRRRGEVEVEPLLLGIADEVPVRAKAPAVAVAELVEDDAADFADAGGHLEEIHSLLG